MAARKRRAKAGTAARLALVLAANALALAVLWRLFAPASDAEARAPRVSPPAPEVRSAPAAALAPSLPEPLRARLERSIRARIVQAVERARKATKGKVHADNVEVAVHVRELYGEAQVAIAADRPLRPASNMKLATTAAALVLLGADWQFDTRFEACGPVQEGVLDGSLVVRAAGDPLYDPEGGGSVEHLLAPVVSALRAEGIAVVRGDLVLDEGTFDGPSPAPGWPEEDQHWAEYCALSAGFSANRGCLTARVAPAAQVGELASVWLEPRDHGLPASFGVRTEGRGPLSIAVGAKPTGVLVRGTIPRSARPWSESFAHPDPVALFGRALWGALARGGIVVQGRLERRRDHYSGRVVAHLRSGLIDLLVPINTHSTNAVADQVFLATGHAVLGRGSREAGGQATALALERLGVPRAGLVQVDGSGLSRDNRVTARQLTALLQAVLALPEPARHLVRDSLAVAGETGTLEERMQDPAVRGRVQAKTGFIGGTSALSGVVAARGGRELVFSILVDYPLAGGLNDSCWKPMQDAICADLANAGP